MKALQRRIAEMQQALEHRQDADDADQQARQQHRPAADAVGQPAAEDGEREQRQRRHHDDVPASRGIELDHVLEEDRRIDPARKEQQRSRRPRCRRTAAPCGRGCGGRGSSRPAASSLPCCWRAVRRKRALVQGQRLLSEIASSTMERRKGTRQPQSRNSASESQPCSSTIWKVEAMMPSGPISCSTLV